ncbi:hypothetical protein KAX17_18665, partial [Candidatus Bipolaricaulota bacterium]|nr:hypothetical protein [Candidatus Bipolaricaulota bacterium]
MKDRYYAGFMQEKPRWMRSLADLRGRLFVFITDAIALIYLWTMVSYCSNTFMFHTKSFVTLPWW